MDGDGIFATELEVFRKDVEQVLEDARATAAILVAARGQVIASRGSEGGPWSLHALMRHFVRREEELDALVKRVQETGAASHGNPSTDEGLRLELLQRRMIVGLGGRAASLFPLRIRQLDTSLRELLARLEATAKAAGVAVPFEEMKAEDVRAAFGR